MLSDTTTEAAETKVVDASIVEEREVVVHWEARIKVTVPIEFEDTGWPSDLMGQAPDAYSDIVDTRAEVTFAGWTFV